MREYRISRWVRVLFSAASPLIIIAVLLTLLIAPLESMLPHPPEVYRAYTCIDIAAPPAKIWPNVTRVREIPAGQDKGWLPVF